MDNLIETLKKVVDILGVSALVLLGLDTLRAIIAYMGVFNPQTKILGRIIYGNVKRETDAITSALKEMGFSSENSQKVQKSFRSISKDIAVQGGVQKEDAAIQLVILLATYTVKFDDTIIYGWESTSASQYYIDTMEISHNKEDLKKMSSIMAHLIYKHKYKKPDVIFSPKGGNPLFAKQVADSYGSQLLISKSSTDKSKVTIVGQNNTEYSIPAFKVNYEGSWSFFESPKKQHGIVLDCNVSGGSQLLGIVKDIKNLADSNPSLKNFSVPTECFVLFRADEDDDRPGDDINKKFSDYNCKIYRFFDLDESIKKDLYQLKERSIEQRRTLSYYNPSDIDEANKIIEKLKQKKKYYYI